MVLKSDPKRDVDNLLVSLEQKLLRAMNTLLEIELMRCQTGVEPEDLREVRLAHSRDPGQLTDGEGFVEVVANVLDNRPEAPGGVPKACSRETYEP